MDVARGEPSELEMLFGAGVGRLVFAAGVRIGGAFESEKIAKQLEGNNVDEGGEPFGCGGEFEEMGRGKREIPRRPATPTGAPRARFGPRDDGC